jgi:hypothetical protein
LHGAAVEFRGVGGEEWGSQRERKAARGEKAGHVPLQREEGGEVQTGETQGCISGADEVLLLP